MYGLYKLHIDCGRMGTLNGLFISEVSEMDKLVKSKRGVYFGEVLGKHSEVYCHITKKDYTLITTDQSVIEIVSKYNLENGVNPFDYIED